VCRRPAKMQVNTTVESHGMITCGGFYRDYFDQYGHIHVHPDGRRSEFNGADNSAIEHG
jgi:hypothetical protein